ncbi:hypothetical protein WUBG_09723 [Wuchereria bancrofti]|uniref:Uncharacterized protein n=1 Tax=Wuchereria bancrofti TaxID=6293 RepID=J9EVZ1_WUCBA|nr:hypothetical protein WUBG_09723 [Wuchereria bancrofti]
MIQAMPFAEPIIWFIVQATTSITIVTTALGYFDFRFSVHLESTATVVCRKHFKSTGHFLARLCLEIKLYFWVEKTECEFRTASIEIKRNVRDDLDVGHQTFFMLSR